MKLIHTSDIHLSSPLTAHLSQSKARERRRELADALRRTVDEGERLGATGVIIAGDLFDTEEVSRRDLDSVIDLIDRHRNITFFYLPGNHEGDALISGRAVLPRNLLVFGEEWTYFDAPGITVAGRRSCKADMFDTLRLDGGRKNIVVLHGELRDRSSAPDVIGRQDARDRGISYLALGHYHGYRYELIDTGCTAVYCGAPAGRGFDETGEHGFVLIDTDTPHTDHTFIPLPGRRLHIVYADVTTARSASDIERAVGYAVTGIPECDIVRAELCGERHQGLHVDADALLYSFRPRFYHFEITDRTKEAVSLEDYASDPSLTGEFVRLVLSSQELDGELRESVLSCGLAALRGECRYDV